MDKYYSYTDFFKSLNQCTEETERERFLNRIYLDLFLNGISRLSRIEQLKQLVDEALDEKNQTLFMAYTEELATLQSCDEYEN